MSFGIEYEFYVHAHFYFTYWNYEKEYGEGIVIANSRTVQLSKCKDRWDRMNVTQLTSFVTSRLPPHVLHPHFSLRRHLLLLIALKYRNIIHWRKSERAHASTSLCNKETQSIEEKVSKPTLQHRSVIQKHNPLKKKWASPSSNIAWQCCT